MCTAGAAVAGATTGCCVEWPIVGLHDTGRRSQGSGGDGVGNGTLSGRCPSEKQWAGASPAA